MYVVWAGGDKGLIKIQSLCMLTCVVDFWLDFFIIVVIHHGARNLLETSKSLRQEK